MSDATMSLNISYLGCTHNYYIIDIINNYCNLI